MDVILPIVFFVIIGFCAIIAPILIYIVIPEVQKKRDGKQKSKNLQSFDSLYRKRYTIEDELIEANLLSQQYPELSISELRICIDERKEQLRDACSNKANRQHLYEKCVICSSPIKLGHSYFSQCRCKKSEFRRIAREIYDQY